MKPETSVIGHEKNIADLKRLADNGTLGQGYLFYGSAMVGKRTVALALAKFLEKGVFEKPHDGEVLQDAAIIDSAFLKNLDGAKRNSIGVDAAREMKNFLFQKPIVGPRRTLVIDDAELLTTEAQNALLKIIEEPPASSLIILIAADPDAILPTVLSRLQKMHFGTVVTQGIAEWLVKNGGVEKARAEEAARRSFGEPGLARKMIFDGDFAEEIAAAENFLRTSPAARRDFIKNLITPDDFSLRKFLASVVLVLSWDGLAKRNPVLWHKTLSLYDTATNFGLNPRLQLESLLMG